MSESLADGTSTGPTSVGSARPRRRLRLRNGSALLTLLATLATLFTLTGWSDMVGEPNDFLDPLGRVVLLYAVAGVALRSLPVPRWLVVLAQLYVLWLLLTTNLGFSLRDALLPTPDLVVFHVDALQAGSAAAQRYPSPVPASVQAIHPLLVAGGAAILVLVDLLAVTLRRVPLAGLPLLAAFTVPVAIVGGFPWITFAVAGAFFVLLLAADHLSRLSQWGRTFVARRSGEEGGALGAGEALQRNGALTLQIGAVALVAAVLAPLAVPQYDGLLAGGGPGSGNGRTVSLDNPITDMQKDLDQGPDVPVLYVTTDDPDPSYLRIAALDTFDDDAWRPGKRELPPEQQLAGDLPPPVGAGTGYRAETYGYTFRATEDLSSTWLPMPFPALGGTVDGDWRYDLNSRDFRAADEGVTTENLSWQATGDVPDPTAQQLVESRPAPASIARRNTELPWEDEDPPWLTQIVEEVTAGTETDFEAAVAMQRWFRRDNRFEYSTANDDGNGLEALEDFLTVDRTGYCEQFATAMALMARVHGIPARVAVGFLRPDRIGPGEVVFSARDLHAWPELFFEGSGWVRFEPTPSVARVVPEYTRGAVPQLQDEEDPLSPSATPTPTPTRQPRQDTTAPTDTTTQDGGPSPWWPVGIVALLALALTPRGLRETARRRRAVGEDGPTLVEGAWSELRATALDLGLPWDDRLTVRVQARSLGRALAAAPVAGRRTSADDAVGEPEAQAALGVLVTAIERSRFSTTPPTLEQGQAAASSADLVGQALRQRAEEKVRLRATWLPRSVASPGRPGPAPARTTVTPEGERERVAP